MIKFIVNFVSAVLGLVGTWLMSRRYARQFGRSFLYALVSPVLLLLGRGGRLRGFVKGKINASRDLPDSVTDMVLGLMLLFWAFFLQLVGLILDLRH